MAALGHFTKGPLLAEAGRWTQHSTLPKRKNRRLSRPAGIDPKRTLIYLALADLFSSKATKSSYFGPSPSCG
jgi:hypothetical protein